jgi:hypothetical protein
MFVGLSTLKTLASHNDTIAIHFRAHGGVVLPALWTGEPVSRYAVLGESPQELGQNVWENMKIRKCSSHANSIIPCLAY